MSGTTYATLTELNEHKNRNDNPHGVSPGQIGAYTKIEADAAIKTAVDTLANVSVQAMELAAEAVLRQNADKANSDALQAHVTRNDNPHGTTAAQIGAAPTESPKFTGTVEMPAYTETISTPAISGSALTLNLAQANVFVVNRTAQINTITIQSPPPAGRAASFTLILTGDGIERTVTWPASIRWAGGTPPEPTHTAGLRDMIVFMSVDQGTTWLGMLSAQRF